MCLSDRLLSCEIVCLPAETEELVCGSTSVNATCHAVITLPAVSLLFCVINLLFTEVELQFYVPG